MKEKRSFFKKLGSFFSGLLLLILIPYLILSLILAYNKVTKLNEVARIFNFVPVVVRDNKMEGTLKKGDFLILKSIVSDPTAVKNGSIIAFRRDNEKKIIIRRVMGTVRAVEIGEDGSIDVDGEYKVKADSSKKNEKKRVFTKEIVGYSFFSIPYIGTYLSYIENTWLLVISLPVLIIVIIILFVIMSKCAAKKIPVQKNNDSEEFNLFSAAELTSGKNIREDLLNSKLKSRKVVNNVNSTPTPTVVSNQNVSVQSNVSVQPQQVQTPKGQDLGGGIYIVPPTEGGEALKPNPSPQPVQQSPQVVSVGGQVTVVPVDSQNNLNNGQNK